MDAELGLRERKKKQTRQVIAETALRLFNERGFESVTVAQVAKAADVSEATVFNYFPTKESLFFGQMQTFEESLIEAVRGRRGGESVLAAFRRFIDEGSDHLARESTAVAISMAGRIVGASPSLRAREREIVADSTDALSLLIAEESGSPSGDIEAWVVANALMGAHRAVVAHVRSEVLAGRHGPALAATSRSQIERVFAILERGLEHYAVKQG
jgi:AcrR family transcriptional regulator